MEIKDPIAALMQSGFPFQTAIEYEISRSGPWRVAQIEAPWTNRDGTPQFLDIVAETGPYTAGVECKKTTGRAYTFLLPRLDAAMPYGARVVAAEQIRDSSRRWALLCSTWEIGPKSYESAFCVVSGTGAKGTGADERLLEKDAARVVLGTEAYARAALPQIPTSEGDLPGRLFIPIITTNAPLFVVHYEPADISLETGSFTAAPRNITPVPWIRFRKSFASLRHRDLGERTVFVVSAARFCDFLVQLALTRADEHMRPGPGPDRIRVPTD